MTLIGGSDASGNSLPAHGIFNNSFKRSWIEGFPKSSKVDANGDFFEPRFTANESGGMNNQEGVTHLKTHLLPFMYDRSAEKPYVLIIDGHGSHVTPEFLQICRDENVIVVVRVPHTTHLTQGEDVKNFKDFKYEAHNKKSLWVGKSMHESARRKLGGDSGEHKTSISWENFGEIVFDAWANAFKKTNNQLAWNLIGINPFTRLPAMDLYESEWNRKLAKERAAYRKTDECKEKALGWLQRGLGHCFPRAERREWSKPDSANGRFTTGDAALCGPMTDPEMKLIEDHRSQKKAAAEQKKIERAAAAAEAKANMVAAGEQAWSQVLQGELKLESLKHAQADAVALFKGVAWPKPADGKANVLISVKRECLESKLGHEVTAFSAALAAAADVGEAADGSASTGEPGASD